MKKGILTGCVLFLCISANAQKVDKDLRLQEVEVTAKRPLKNTGIEKTQLDTMVLHDNIALSMADILQQSSTLFIKSYGRATESTAEFRGTSPSHTQVTWNGMKINSPMIGTVDFSTIPAYFIDEANLYHGASSITLSGGGLGGAVELNSKPAREDGFNIQTIWGLGSFGTRDQFYHVTYKNNRWNLSTRFVDSRADNDYKYTNYDKMVDVRDDVGNIIRSYHPVEKNKSGYFHDTHVMQDIYYTLSNGHKMGGSIWYTQTKRGLPFLSVDYKDDTDFTNEQNHHTLRGVLSWDWNNELWKVGAKGGYTYNDVAYDYFTTRNGERNDITSSQSYTNTYFGELNAEFIPSAKWVFNADLTTYYHHVKSADRSPFHIGDNFNIGRPEYTGSVSARWRPYEPLSFAAVVREEIYKDDVVPVIPAFFAEYVAYKPLNLVLKTSVARNYRYPTLDDLYFQPGGNPELGPERGFTYDFGAEFNYIRPFGNIKGNVSIFDSHIKDWILWAPNTRGYWEPSNVKEVHNYGIEATMSSVYKINKEWNAELMGNFSWTPSKNMGEPMNSNDESYGKQLCYVPVYSAGINARIRYKSWMLNCKWNFYSERFTTTSNEVNYITGKLEPYYMTDISLEKSFKAKFFHASIKLQVNNLFDREYVTVLSRPMPGRNFEVFIELKPLLKKKRL